MRGSPAVPPVGTGLDAVADIARRRAEGWAIFGQMFAIPTLAWVGEVRDGVVRQRLEQAVGWREGELDDFGPPMIMLGAFERTSRRRDIAVDLQRLTAAHSEMADAEILEAALVACDLLRGLGGSEHNAWSSGRLPRARDLRIHQDHELRGEAGEVLQVACSAILGGTARQPYVALGQLCQLWVGRERVGRSLPGL